MARPQKQKCICSVPRYLVFTAAGVADAPPITLTYEEYEILRLLDVEHLSQAECAVRMSTSRATVARLYAIAREKTARHLVSGAPLVIDGGEYTLCMSPRPECADIPYCCHRDLLSETK